MNALVKVFAVCAALLIMVVFCWICSIANYPDNRQLPRESYANFFTSERVLIICALGFVLAALGVILWSQLRNFAEPDYYMALKHHHRHHRRHHHHHHRDSPNSDHGDSTHPSEGQSP